MIRIMLVDDHVMIREALRGVLEQDRTMQVVAAVGDGKTALRQAAELLPDVVVMDVTLPGPSGIEITRRLHDSHPQIRVLALSTHLDRHIIQQMFDAGAHGYIVKSAAGTALQQGIRSVVEGRSYLCAESAALVAATLSGRKFPTGKSGTDVLTERELQVLTLLAEGNSAPDIAATLNIAYATVDVHRRNIMKKLGLHNVVDLTRHAIRAGLILP
ncbi:MAG: response regulator transcription factor [Rhodocyclaceae bacterium]|nr:response regulator transcription factor [Rhodocyclaceae bacterium]MDZ4213248.1 response regulator transcription factor [Rhodocyclaceae bacterium]